ncbi:hypothetical protein ACDQ55_08445 [Chitinophaga sp. 30R24]|uniref:hypothetical protein n=1 Tax=Chitinophaga sp. 30R24 TaxID=3248838 RepID=UPI003B8F4488
MIQKVVVDFNNCDRQGRVRLNCIGTLNDLARLNIALKTGLELLLNDEEELSAIGTVQFSEDENIWVASFSRFE